MRLVAGLLSVLALAACGVADGPGVADSAHTPPPLTAEHREAGERADRGSTDELAPMPPFGMARIALRGPDGQRLVMPVYVADDPDTRRQGLMGVEELPWDAGMVFLFPEDTTGGFWMKDTLLPLSIAFFAADGAVLAVLDMEPCAADPCPKYYPGVAYRVALEVNQSRFAELGLDGTWTVELPAELRGQTG